MSHRERVIILLIASPRRAGKGSDRGPDDRVLPRCQLNHQLRRCASEHQVLSVMKLPHLTLNSQVIENEFENDSKVQEWSIPLLTCQ